jgi:putative transcriptional regulator
MRNRLQEFRRATGLNQTELGARVGVSRETICNIEGGRHDPSMPLGMALARFLGVPAEDLFPADEDAQVVIHSRGQRRGPMPERRRKPQPPAE